MVRETRVGRSPRGRNPSIRVQIPASPSFLAPFRGPGGKPLRGGMKELMTVLQGHKPGDTIELNGFRDRAERRLPVTLAEAPSE